MQSEPLDPGLRKPWNFVLLYKYLVLGFVTLLIIAPLITTALGGFKSAADLRTNPFGLPTVWHWNQYTDILLGIDYWRYMGNSMLISAISVFVTLLCSTLAAFTFAHVKFFGKEFIVGYLMVGLLFPVATAILPLFVKVRDMGLLNTYWGVILPTSAFSLGMSILLMRNMFEKLPRELLSAALVDGCGYIRFFWHITLPLSRPILATVGIIAFVASWNQYVLPLILLNSEERYPWPLGIMEYQGEFTTDWHLILAFVTLTVIPAIVVFLATQKYIVAGLTAGAVKG
ncbi:thiamine ABC transporter ATP-binding protein [Actibacterium mucosum KCTC 23349]|uniref:Thiamine ABC transporter ATP-binding protein n=1 Tax=Actibacterium mucosum KCTC 23349 TaxID=1454373 RepID=A0A037ZES3_9RHOB|nr:carbohydrate ABC transporter permease [Actibacterium mucosum]KAJ54642.1 thiamine ABC transporter ATP-binding protein [Actibacterium mucosum KCTC 23349]